MPPVHLSVVIPAYRAGATLPRVLAALAPQVEAGGREVIVVESGVGAGTELLGGVGAGQPWLQVLPLAERALPGRARNVGVGQAHGPLVAFLDADSIPEPDWLDRLEASLDETVDAVAGAVLNGTPWHPVGTAGYLLEFSEWLPGRGRLLFHGASCNLLVRRACLARLGGFPEDVFPGEDTILTFRLAAGGRLRFAPDAAVRHLNRTGGREFIRHQRRLGAAFAAVCASVPFPHRAFARPAMAPFAVLLRLAALAKRLSRHPAEALSAVVVLPVILVGLVAWAWGSARGPLHGGAGRPTRHPRPSLRRCGIPPA